MRKAMELVDSRLSEIERHGDALWLVFPHAYVHQSEGSPGRDPGTEWSQELVLIFHDGRLEEGTAGALPDTIVDGAVTYHGVDIDILPLPFSRTGPASLRLALRGGGELRVSGRDPVIEARTSPIFVEYEA